MLDLSQRAVASPSHTRREHQHDELRVDNDQHIIDIHALPPPPGRRRSAEDWETGSHRSFLSTANTSTETFASISREFSALLLAGTVNREHHDSTNDLERIGEEEQPLQETNTLAIVPDIYNNPSDSMAFPVRAGAIGSSSAINGNLRGGEVSVQRVKKDEVESKINAWQMEKIAKINNRFKRDEAIINGRESEEVHKATCRMKKVERKLEEKKTKALEKMQNNIAKAQRKAEERMASAEAKRATKVAGVVEISNIMRTAGRAPVKRSFF